MRRIPRFERSFDLLHSRSVSAASVPYICSVCRLQTTSFSTSQASQAKVSVAERLRQKIWGTSAPPGQEDPYGGPSTIEKNKAAKKASKARKAPTSQEPRPTPKPYKRATTWEALEEFGLQEPEPLQLNSFVPAEVITDGFEITTCLHRAMVEVFACSQAGRPLSDVWRMEPTVDQTHKIQIKPSETGVQLEFPDSMTSQQLLASLSPMALEEQTETLADETTSEEVIVESQQLEGGNSVQSKDVEEVSVKAQEDIKESVADTQPDDGPASAASLTYLDVVESWGPSWLQISLYEPDIKFAVLKRTMQLTGIRIKDSEIRGINTAHSLLRILIQPPKPAKLVETLVENEKLMTLPNISVFAKKVTKIDKEIQVGRWKIIEKELEKRGLPLTHRG